MHSKILRNLYLTLFLAVGLFLLLMFAYPFTASFMHIDNYFLAKLISDTGTFYYAFCRLICHQMPERSIFIGTVQMAFCFRCFAITVGMVISGLVAVLRVPEGNWSQVLKKLFFLPENAGILLFLLVMAVCGLPMIIDGFSQILFTYESNTVFRIITGLFYGYGQGTVCIVLLSVPFRIFVQKHEKRTDENTFKDVSNC